MVVVGWPGQPASSFAFLPKLYQDEAGPNQTRKQFQAVACENPNAVELAGRTGSKVVVTAPYRMAEIDPQFRHDPGHTESTASTQGLVYKVVSGFEALHDCEAGGIRQQQMLQTVWQRHTIPGPFYHMYSVGFIPKKVPADCPQRSFGLAGIKNLHEFQRPLSRPTFVS